MSKTVKSPYQLEIRYDISWMISTYGSESLFVDDFLAVIMLIRAWSLYYRENNIVSKEAQLRKYCYDLINLYNANHELVDDDLRSQLGALKGGGTCLS